MHRMPPARMASLQDVQQKSEGSDNGGSPDIPIPIAKLAFIQHSRKVLLSQISPALMLYIPLFCPLSLPAIPYVGAFLHFSSDPC